MLAEHILILAISGLGVFHGISLGVFLLIKSEGRSLSNKLLGTLLVVFGLRISKSIFLYFTTDLDITFIILGLNLILSFGPLFYLYARSFLDEQFSLQKRHLLHAIPFLIFLSLNITGFLSNQLYLNSGIIFIYIHFLIYIIASFIGYQSKWKSNNQEGKPMTKQWMNYIHWGIMTVWLSYFMFLFDGLIPYIAGPITYSLVIYPLSFWAILKKVHKPEEKKYQNSRLENQESLKIISMLEEHIQQDKPFLNPDIKLPMVAAQLNITAHALSQAVNENFGQNFQQYLNGHRVKFAQSMLLAEKYAHYTISAIAFDSGFNSLSAFNTAFKKASQTTPSQYRKGKLTVNNI